VLAQVRGRGGEVVHLLAGARGLYEWDMNGTDSAELARERLKVKSRASALLGRGRAFFPNFEYQSADPRSVDYRL
jgi:hypothetical protein